MDRSLHVPGVIADDGSPSSGGDGHVIAPRQRQSVQHDARDLFDAASGPGNRCHTLQFYARRTQCEQDRQNVIACTIYIQNDPFHQLPCPFATTGAVRCCSVSRMIFGLCRHDSKNSADTDTTKGTISTR